METRRHRLARYATTTLILSVIGALFLRQQLADAPGADDTGLLDARPLGIGAPAPDFALRALDGSGLVRLADYRGKTVVVNFWASWCTPCREEMADFEALYRARGQAAGDFVILAIDYSPLDGEADARRFVESYADGPQPLSFPIAFDTPAGAVAERYGVAQGGARQAALPVSFFIDRDGVVREKVLGPVTGMLEERVRAAETPLP